MRKRPKRRGRHRSGVSAPSADSAAAITTTVESFIAKLFSEIPSSIGVATVARERDTSIVYVKESGAAVFSYAVPSDCHVVGFSADSAAFLSLSNAAYLTQDGNTGIQPLIIAFSNSNFISPRMNYAVKSGQILYFVCAANCRMMAIITLDTPSDIATS